MSRTNNPILILISLWALMFVASSQFFIMSPLLPQMERELCISEAYLGFIVGVYSVSLGITALFAGILSDRVGRRHMLKIGSLLMGISLMLHVFAINFHLLMLFRLLAGISGGLLTGTCVSYVRDYFPYEKRGKANGIIITGSALGQIAGIPLGILLAEELGFSSPFLVLGVFMLMAFVLIHFCVPQPISVPGHKRVEAREATRQYWTILRQPVYQRAAMGYILMFFSITIYLIYFPKWLTETKAATSAELAFVFLIGGIASLLGGPVAGWLSDRVGRTSVTITASMVMAGAMGASLFFLLDAMIISATFFVVMLCLSGRSIAFQSGVSDMTSVADRGKAMNLMISLGQIGMAGGSALAGLIYSDLGFTVNTILAIISCTAMALLVAGKWMKVRHYEMVAAESETAEDPFVPAPSLAEQL
ncbi:MAG: MFS transporter [Cytophagales bacterium]|nr:MFS transporter [Cytophagales bacterium]